MVGPWDCGRVAGFDGSILPAQVFLHQRVSHPALIVSSWVTQLSPCEKLTISARSVPAKLKHVMLGSCVFDTKYMDILYGHLLFPNLGRKLA